MRVGSSIMRTDWSEIKVYLQKARLAGFLAGFLNFNFVHEFYHAEK